eukprot:2218332-Amphidinium_carterae.4
MIRGTDDGEFLVSKALLPASGLEEATDFKPDHIVIRMPLAFGENLARFWWPARGCQTTKNTQRRMASP